ncbi:MAG TPA: YraN family protein [Gemmatimonadales bacterium]|nr:YraN family protein [Gemmatimonadales bacterium]
MPTSPVPPEQWTDRRHRDGWDGELIAADWLRRRGWRVEAHRFRLGRHDLDLIARRGELVAFVEVKARRSTRCGAGEEAVSLKKRLVIERVAWSWIVRHGRIGDQYRFDVIALAGNGPGAADLRRIADAWRPGWR